MSSTQKGFPYQDQGRPSSINHIAFKENVTDGAIKMAKKKKKKLIIFEQIKHCHP